MGNFALLSNNRDNRSEGKLGDAEEYAAMPLHKIMRWLCSNATFSIWLAVLLSMAWYDVGELCLVLI